MAAVDVDPLLLLRQAIAANQPAVPSMSADATSAAPSDDVALARATHLVFPHRGTALPMDAPTRFASNDVAVDLRSIFFAWRTRDVAIPEYNAQASGLNDELAAAGHAGRVQNLGFIEKLDLITWLEGASEESEYIKPLSGDEQQATEAAAASAAAAAPSSSAAVAAPGPAGKTGAAATVAQARSGKGTLDARLDTIYGGERSMGNRNTILRGVKATDFSHVRKLAAPFLQRRSQASAAIGSNPSLALNQKLPARRPDPIILLSPSASSLLRLSNARSFLEEGHFVPPDPSASTASMLHVQRLIRSIEPHRPMRFILVEGSERFKPDDWNRVVGVFTTGQTWQFKNYQWSNPNELFKHTLGVYVGWRGDANPDVVTGWGVRVLQVAVDRWRGGDGSDASRFRDKEVTEHIWKAIEMNMRTKGWRRDAAPSSI